jgi:hypothetical protein
MSGGSRGSEHDPLAKIGELISRFDEVQRESAKLRERISGMQARPVGYPERRSRPRLLDEFRNSAAEYRGTGDAE